MKEITCWEKKTSEICLNKSAEQFPFILLKYSQLIINVSKLYKIQIYLQLLLVKINLLKFDILCKLYFLQRNYY